MDICYSGKGRLTKIDTLGLQALDRNIAKGSLAMCARGELGIVLEKRSNTFYGKIIAGTKKGRRWSSTKPKVVGFVENVDEFLNLEFSRG